MITPGDFLSQAYWLLNQTNPSESNCRSAISRAYYSLYHESLTHLKEKYKDQVINKIKSFTVEKGYANPLYDPDEHEKRINELNSDYILGLGLSFHRIIPNILRSLNYNYSLDFKQHRKKRNDADYNLDITITQKYAKNEVESISNLIAAIRNL
jgi:uncharacterized protein YpuA (DUF1002 family)